MFGLVVRFTCKDEASAEAFDQLVAETIKKIRDREPGTLVYASHRVDGQPLLRIFYELYRDRAAFDAHEEQTHTKHFLGARGELLSSVEVDWLQLQSGKGTDG
ncbi:putative quinol monooxygenase [Sphaerisporangium viridialbum]|uniref:putative quinol monooxygenase n=1 Tax=Sphaerisporangium viridialbum TaxID=46189 RepID=UPI003C72265B